MPQHTSEQIRQEFLDFFREKEHEIVRSASLVPHDDPTLLFTNAGMNQFKDVFLGTGSRPYVRAADTQKCLRVSGKHNDLEEVGYDTYHHTFFEMLGNWSFGDYFKREAIRWAWELLVERWGLEPDRLYATVHEGDEKLGLEADTEAAELWKSETSIHPDHILFGNSKDNFWMMGDTGPCGPCSEVHIDLRSDAERAATPGRDLVNQDDPRVMEIWNLVFIQYNALRGMSEEGRGKREALLARVEQAASEEAKTEAQEALRQFDESGEGMQTELKPLTAKHVDTGMGFERIVGVLQQTNGSTYDTDLFTPILQVLADQSPRAEVKGYDDIRADDDAERDKIRIAMRVVADHLRACAFAIADGVIPGNVGQGYVIRRILRRAVRYGYQTLGFRKPFIHTLVAPLVDKMGGAFDELVKRQDYIERVIRAEEESFLETLGTGIQFFERIAPYIKADLERDQFVRLKRDNQALDLLGKAYSDVEDRTQILEQFAAVAAQRLIPGEVAFLLHDTYGFPIDLTQLMAREEGLGVDMKRYNELMQQQRDRARAAASFGVVHGAGDDWQTVSTGDETFVGYDTESVENAVIRAVRTIEMEDGGQRYEVVLDQTPFYAESGGQVGDIGVLTIGGEDIQVLDTQKEQGRIVHVVDRLPAALDAPVKAVVDAARRHRIMKHHTATHLLHAALRETLGTHVQQKGSLVAPDRLRFDFSHFERVTPDELHAVEQRVNEMIQRNIRRGEERNIAYEEALACGAMALFGEKYGDTVRMITFDPDYSVELCGGIHVDATGELGLFKFLSEGSVAAGVRRVEAVSGQAALDYIDREMGELEQARSQFKTRGLPLDEEIAALLETRKTLEKELDALRLQSLESHLNVLIQNAESVEGVRLVTGRVPNADMNTLRDLGQTLSDRLGEGSVGVLGTVDPEGEKVYLVATVSADLIKRGVQAGKLVGALAKHVGGGGGGRPNLATAGGKQPEKLDDALAQAGTILREML